jgi:hypothetical protein
MNQKGLVGHSRQPQNPQARLGDVDTGQIQSFAHRRLAPEIPHHLWRFAEECR